MKITLNSSDGLGDLVLRVPLVRGLVAAGHELQLLTCSPANALAKEIFPGVRVHTLSESPYEAATRRKTRPFRKDFAAIAKFKPDLYLAGSFQLNFFDERWLLSPAVTCRTLGFRSTDPIWLTGTNTDPFALADRLSQTVEVDPQVPELQKNARLAEALSLPLDLPIPRFQASEEAVGEAREWLQRAGLPEGKYLVVCAGARKGIAAKDWGEKNWSTGLATLGKDLGIPLLFLGNTAESASIERIRAALPDSMVTWNLAAAPLKIPPTLALIAASAGYVGRDSGLMHLAAASGRQILALFGGGHWGRFLPSSGPAVVLTQAMPCRSCHWHCPMERPHCIRDITVENVEKAWKRLQEPGFDQVEIFEAPCPPELIVTVAEKAAQRLALVSSWAERDRFDGQRARNGVDRLAQSLSHLARRFSS